MLAALQNDLAGVNHSIRAALDRGLRDPQFFREPVFAGVQDDVEFKALQQELDAMLAIERTDVLQLICHNNPVPGAWQPLTATCMGVPSKP